MSKKTKTVLLLGSTAAAYRPSLWASYFMERSRDYSLIVDPCNWGQHLSRPIRIALRIMHLLLGYLGSDIVVIQPMNQGNPYSQMLLRLNRIFRKQIIVDVYISLYETHVIDRKTFDPDSKQAQQAFQKDRRAFLGASKVVFLNRAEASYYQQILEIERGALQTAIIPLVVPERPMARLPYFNGHSDVPTIAWWGREGNPLHGFENIAEACRLLLESGYQARSAFFCAGGKQWAAFKEQYSFLRDYKNVIFTCESNFANGKLTRFLLEETDLALGTFGNTQKARTVLVNKVLDAASFGLPCLTQHSDGMLENFVPDETIYLSSIEPEAIAANIRACLESREKSLALGLAARELVRSKFSPDSFNRSVDALLLDA